MTDQNETPEGMFGKAHQWLTDHRTQYAFSHILSHETLFHGMELKSLTSINLPPEHMDSMGLFLTIRSVDPRFNFTKMEDGLIYMGFNCVNLTEKGEDNNYKSDVCFLVTPTENTDLIKDKKTLPEHTDYFLDVIKAAKTMQAISREKMPNILKSEKEFIICMDIDEDIHINDKVNQDQGFHTEEYSYDVDLEFHVLNHEQSEQFYPLGTDKEEAVFIPHLKSIGIKAIEGGLPEGSEYGGNYFWLINDADSLKKLKDHCIPYKNLHNQSLSL